jgi:hypothetical protein
VRIKRRDTAKRYGVSVRTIERWEADPTLIPPFPQSEMVNGRRYDVVEKLDAYDAQCAAAARTTRTPLNAGRPNRAAPGAAAEISKRHTD